MEYGFEFNELKSKANALKHGIDFVRAQQLWLDDKRIEIPARTEHEPRFVVIGHLDGRLWSAFITYRGERIRLISVRRARPEEEQLYESQDA